MKIASALFSSSVGVALAFAPSVFAVDVSPKTIEQCAALLPSGKTYSFQMTGTIDRTQDKPILHGTLSVDDGSHMDRGNEGEAFGKCIAQLIQ